MTVRFGEDLAWSNHLLIRAKDWKRGREEEEGEEENLC